MPSRISNLAGFTTSITSTTNLNVGVVTASSFVGDVTGTATGLSGTPNLNVGVVTATSFVGNLTGTASTASFATTSFGLSGTPNLNVGVVTATGVVVSGGATFNGHVNLGDNTTDNINVSGEFISNLIPDATGTYDLGSTTQRWRDIWISRNTTISGDLTIGGNASVTGVTTFANSIDIEGAVETVSVGSTYDLGGGRVVLECDAQNGTVFTHNLANGTVGIVSLRNFPVTKNSITTFTILFTQSSTTPSGGIGNTVATNGIGTNVFLTPLGVTGFTTSARVATGSTVTLSNTANDIDIVTLAIHYNGSGTGTPGNYITFATGNTGFRFGSVGF